MDPRNDTNSLGVPPARGDLSRPVSPAGQAPANSEQPRQDQQAAANVIRTQIDALFGHPAQPTQDTQQPSQQPVQQTPHPLHEAAAAPAPQSQQQADLQNTNPYDRTHQDHPQPQADQWKQYHSAWQNYYQKYYEGYYAHQATQVQAQSSPVQPAAQQQNGFFSQQVESAKSSEEISKDEALFELRQKLLGNVRNRAEKVRKSRHFVPIIAAFSVMLVFLFLQYNQVLFATVNAYVSPGAIDPQNIVIDPAGGTAVSQDPRLIIPKINVDVPVMYGVGNDHNSQMAAMENGVAHFAIPGASSRPGEIGNTVLSGHSSNDLFDGGDYKFIFAQLEKLKEGDTIYANYEGVRYTYVVTKMEVVKPTEVSKLVYDTNKPVMTLITCTPLGTSRDRLLVTAEQVSPDPAKGRPAPSTAADAGENTAIPGASAPTLIERLFGAR